MTRSLHFGAGNIGRGFIGKLLSEASFKVVFADVAAVLIDELEARKSFTVRVVGDDTREEEVKIDGAVMSNTDAIYDEIYRAELITTAVGPRILQRLAPTLVKGILRRKADGITTPLSIIACENSFRATSQLASFVFAELESTTDPETVQWVKENVGFIDCAVDRIVPPAKHEDILKVTVEEFCEWVVDKLQFTKAAMEGCVMHIPNVIYTDNLNAFIERKLLTVNTGHAICAYLGKIRGYPDIRTSISDPEIKAVVHGAMRESGAVLVKRYGFKAADQEAYIQKILGRFANPYIDDDVSRVGREPMRKLSKEDRLIKPLAGCMEYGLPYENLAVGIAAALLYHDPEDPQAVTLQEMVKEKGREAVLKEICGLDQHQTALDNVVEQIQLLHTKSGEKVQM